MISDDIIIALPSGEKKFIDKAPVVMCKNIGTSQFPMYECFVRDNVAVGESVLAYDVKVRHGNDDTFDVTNPHDDDVYVYESLDPVTRESTIILIGRPIDR